jgi:hypothetical protein
MAVDLRELLPGLHLLPLGISNAYLWRAAEGATPIDTGRRGAARRSEPRSNTSAYA